VPRPTTDDLLAAVAWPGEKPRGRFLPAAVAAAVGLVAGPRAGLWQLGAWGVSPIDTGLKRLVNRPRPMPGRLNPRGGMPQGPSFPSSHVSDYVVTLGFASWVLRRKRSPAALPVALTSAGLIGLIGPSRVRTGDHRWSDVVAGYVLGAAYLVVLIRLARRDPELRADSSPRSFEGQPDDSLPEPLPRSRRTTRAAAARGVAS
jgi:membrane-associated phospholipid phosphatase